MEPPSNLEAGNTPKKKESHVSFLCTLFYNFSVFLFFRQRPPPTRVCGNLCHFFFHSRYLSVSFFLAMCLVVSYFLSRSLTPSASITGKIRTGCASVLNTCLFSRSMGVSGSNSRYIYFIVSAKKKVSILSFGI